jgi:hypothetical protein
LLKNKFTKYSNIEAETIQDSKISRLFVISFHK